MSKQEETRRRLKASIVFDADANATRKRRIREAESLARSLAEVFKPESWTSVRITVLLESFVERAEKPDSALEDTIRDAMGGKAP